MTLPVEDLPPNWDISLLQIVQVSNDYQQIKIWENWLTYG